MCCAAQPPQVPYQGQNGAARSRARRDNFDEFGPPRPPCGPGRARPAGRRERPRRFRRRRRRVRRARRPCPRFTHGGLHGRGAPRQEFLRPRAAQHRGGDRGRGSSSPALRCRRRPRRMRARSAASSLDPPLDDVRRADLELRLDQADEPRAAPRRGARTCGNTRRCEMKLTSQTIASGARRRSPGQGPRIQPFEGTHARVVGEFGRRTARGRRRRRRRSSRRASGARR